MKKRIAALILSLCLTLSIFPAITLTASAVSVTGLDVASLVDAANSAIGKTAAQLGLPSGDWCGYFIGNRINNSQLPAKLGYVTQDVCAFPIVLVSWVCATKDAGVFYVASPPHQNRLLEIDPRLGENGRMVSRTCAGWNPVPGDILQFTWSNWNQRIFDHGGIVVSVDGDWLTYVDGNSSAGVVAAHTIRKDSPTIVGHIRFTVDGESAPSTTPITPPSTPPEYFDCFVQIQCFEGQAVNLFYNPGDNSRVDYFDKGQRPKSVYGAKLSDGSTWYRVNVRSLALNRDADLWLKYESSKMTVTDIPESYTVHLDENGGYVSSKYMIVTDGEAFGTLLTPTRDGYIFDGWYTSASGGTQVTSTTIANSSYDECTLYAHWTKDTSALSVNSLEDGNWRIMIGEEWIRLYKTAVSTESSGTYHPDTIDCCQRAVLSDGSVRYCAKLTFPTGEELRWIIQTDKMSVEDLKQTQVYTVTLDANGGTVSPFAIEVEQNSTYGSLPKAEWGESGRRYEFIGWYTAREGGTPVKGHQNLVKNADHTLYAHWEEVEDAAPSVSLQNFTARNIYHDGLFRDVDAGAWYVGNVSVIYQLGLMKGTGANTFEPKNNITIAEAVTLAARLHSIYYTGEDDFEAYDGRNWYDPYVNYARENGIISENYNYALPASREVFAHILAKALPEFELTSIRSESIHFADAENIVYAGDVELLCKAGVITGMQSGGVTKFLPKNTITRAEASAVVTRMAKPALRK